MMVLYSGTTCPFSHRCRFVLFEKGMDFEIRDVDLYNKPEDINVMNPYGQVPILVDLAEALRDPRENILVQPGDTIVLPGCRDCAAGKCKLHPVRPRIWHGPGKWKVEGCDSCADGP